METNKEWSAVKFLTGLHSIDVLAIELHLGSLIREQSQILDLVRLNVVSNANLLDNLLTRNLETAVKLFGTFHTHLTCLFIVIKD